MGSELDAARERVDEALQLLDSETADGIIGAWADAAHPNEELAILEQGAQAVVTMLWGMVQACSVRGQVRERGKRPSVESRLAPVKKAAAQSMLLLATLIHYAYALGIRRGRGE